MFFIVTDAGELCQNVVYLFSELKRNTDDIQELRNEIMEVLRQEPYMGEKIPVR